MRVITEPERAPAFEYDDTLAGAFRYELEAVGPDRGGDTSVSTGPGGLGKVGQLGDELRVIVRVGCVIPRISSRADAGSPVESIHLDAGVIRDGRKPGCCGNDARLGQRILGERVEWLLEDEIGCDVVQRDQVDIGEEGGNLLGLVSVARGEDRFQSARAFSWCSRSSRMPFSAMSIRVSSSSRAKTPFSAVP